MSPLRRYQIKYASIMRADLKGVFFFLLLLLFVDLGIQNGTYYNIPVSLFVVLETFAGVE